MGGLRERCWCGRYDVVMHAKGRGEQREDCRDKRFEHESGNGSRYRRALQYTCWIIR
jgi:hypothetical protein